MFGTSVKRSEDFRLITGQGRYVADISLPDQTYMHVVRSPHAHGSIRAIDKTAALGVPGVLAVFCGDDLEEKEGLPPNPITDRFGQVCFSPYYPVLARGFARYAGQPVALVIAESRDLAQDGADLVMVEYQELPHVTNVEDALQPQAAQIWPQVPGNLSFDWEHGQEEQTEQALKQAAHVVELDFFNTRLCANPIETRGAIGSYDKATKRYHLYANNQGAHGLRDCLADILGIAHSDLRVITPDIGGGFGMKAPPYPEQAAVLAAARIIGRPVCWVGSRSESFLSDAPGRDHFTKITLGLDEETRFCALKVDSCANLGAYISQHGTFIPTSLVAWVLPGVYCVPHVWCRVRGVFTNTTPIDAYRGAGRPEAAFAVERIVDTAAYDLGMDPVELRRKNLLPAKAIPYQSPMGPVIESGNFPETFARALAQSGYAQFGERKKISGQKGLLRGIGVIHYLEITGLNTGDTTRIKFENDATVTLFVGSISNGQGHETTYRQLMQEKLGVAPEKIRVVEGDTEKINASSSGVGGSHFLQLAGPSLYGAADKIIAKGKKIAAKILEAAEEDIEFSAGKFAIGGTDQSINLEEIAKIAHMPEKLDPELEPGFDESYYYRAKGNSFPNGVHICEVEIDPQTGKLQIVAYHVIDDFGVLVNPMLVEGQVHGGVAQGVGQALFEHCRYDPASGQLITGSFMDYCMPRADDLPYIQFTHHGAPSTANPLGVKGCGEAGAIGATPAAVNAVMDALKEYGIRHLDMPLTSERIWQAIQRKNSKPPEKENHKNYAQD